MRITVKQLRRIIKEEVSRVLVEEIDENFDNIKIKNIIEKNRKFLKKICQDQAYESYGNEKLSDIVRDHFSPDDQDEYYDMFDGDFDIQNVFGEMTLENLAVTLENLPDRLSSEEIHDAYSQENEEGMKANW